MYVVHRSLKKKNTYIGLNPRKTLVKNVDRKHVKYNLTMVREIKLNSKNIEINFIEIKILFIPQT